MRKILVLGIDVVSKKNQYQFSAMQEYNTIYYVVEGSKSSFRAFSNSTAKVYSSEYFAFRLMLALFLLLRRSYNHIELYSASRIGFIYVALSKLFKQKIILVERGDIGHFKSYSMLTRFSLKVGYKYSDAIWYKEPYMERLLKLFTTTRLYFIHNAVPLPASYELNVRSEKKYSFIWANRDIPKRKFGWVYSSANALIDKDHRALFLGIANTIKYPSTKNIRVDNYVELGDRWNQSKFFLLPSTIVFANYALLEAMSHGVVPVVTKSKGVNLLVENNLNGLVSKFDYYDYKLSMSKALVMDDDEYHRLSKNARMTIMRHYSLESFGRKLDKLYRDIN